VGKAKDFIMKSLGGEGPAPFRALYRAMQSGEYYLGGNVTRTGHYVHERSTTVSLDSDLPDELSGAVSQLEDYVQEMAVDLNREIGSQLEAELEYQQSDEAVIESLDANERYFDEETGEEIDMDDFAPISAIQPGPLRDKILRHYVDLFDHTPEEVYQALMRRGAKFDHHGNHVDTTPFKQASELSDELKSKVCDKYRNWNTDDESWSRFLIDEWKERLEAMGFSRVDISYSLGGMQGDGASFTADSIDGIELLKHILKIAQKREHVEAVVNNLVG